MKIKTTIKNAWKIYRAAAKLFVVDTGITILCIVAVLYLLFVNHEASMEGAVVILFLYSIANVIRFNIFRKEIKKLKDGNPK